ncbi:MAG: 4Fe-4S dicluster domain-containing protein [Verrucomicrobia bacterium]|nr:MAG: 4Fe-4S dicluster domain-containing protein [Verrucomicrobiota bacterium]
MSKRILNHPSIPADETTVSWRSQGQLEDSASFRQWLEREFPQGAAEMADGEDVETSRRSFLKLMGASTALAGFGMASCRRPEAYLVPYTKAPEWVIPGKATYYASSMPRPHGATPLVVTTFEGRPTKVAPNHLHPDAGGTDAFAQASVLDLYSPSRSRRVIHQKKVTSVAELEKAIAALAADSSAKLGIVYGTDVSPTRVRLTEELKKKFSAAKFYQYEALTGDVASALPDGVKLAANFSHADRILALDCDFVGDDCQGPTAAFFDRRKPEGRDYTTAPDAASMNRLYVVEGAFTVTGGMADHRLRIAPSQVAGIAAAVAQGLGIAISAPALSDEKHLAWVAALVEDLKENAGKSLVLAGSRQPAAVQQIAVAINQALGNIGEGKPLAALQSEAIGLGSLAQLRDDVQSGAIDSLLLLTPANPIYDAPADFQLSELFSKLKLVIHHGMRTDATAHAATWHVPAAHYLESWSDARTSSGVYTVVQPMILPLYPDCISEFELLLALLATDGKLLFGEGKDGAASPAYDAVRATFSAIGGAGDEVWKQLLRDGFFAGSTYAAASLTPALGAIVVPAAPTTSALEVVFATDSSVYDGRWIDNGWLQEAPDPITKATWDNAALIAPATAEALGITQELRVPEPKTKFVGVEGKYAKVGPDGEGEHRTQRMIEISVNGKSLKIPVLVSFGQAENVIVIPLGYGQGFDADDELKRDTSKSGHVGLVGVNTGFDAYPLRTSASAYIATGATVKVLDQRYSMALTQEHHAMYGRALAREISTMVDKNKGSFEEQLADVPKQGNDSHAPPNIYLYKPEDTKGEPLINDKLHQWAMSIDLSSCTGCNACLVACQAENNIPIVGKKQVAAGREMHWIRMDRYYATQADNTFDAGNPELVPQPVACVHCESAPCETVCPVNATIHSEDGLNVMAYNRCIGTRYCANNCPYKARRFNYFDYNKRNPLIAKNLYKGPFGVKQVGEAPHLQRNPNVSVRMRGVMEKCTYCVQRLKDAVIRQKRGQKQGVLESGKPSPAFQVTETTLRIPVDSVKVACQDACVAGAITFGNLLDKEKSAMARSKEIARNYDLLHYIGTRPRTSYLARVKNPNPKMPDAAFVGKATVHMV